MFAAVGAAACGHSTERGVPPPAQRSGVLAGVVDSALVRAPKPSCRAARGDSGIGLATGCHTLLGDTLFFFYVDHAGVVTSWGRTWKASISDPVTAAGSLEVTLSARFGAGQPCDGAGRVAHFRIWRRPGHFLMLYADPEAAELRVKHDLWMAARLGEPTCSWRDWVSVPFRR